MVKIKTVRHSRREEKSKPVGNSPKMWRLKKTHLSVCLRCSPLSQPTQTFRDIWLFTMTNLIGCALSVTQLLFLYKLYTNASKGGCAHACWGFFISCLHLLKHVVHSQSFLTSASFSTAHSSASWTVSTHLPSVRYFLLFSLVCKIRGVVVTVIKCGCCSRFAVK